MRTLNLVFSPSRFKHFIESPKGVSVVEGLVLLLIGLFYVCTIRPGHGWGGDNCQYILHARNIVRGIPYRDIGVIFNPLSAIFPQSYPPVFPLILAPVYFFCGPDFFPMKIVLIFIFLGILMCLLRLYRSTLLPEYRILLIGLIGFNPLFWNYKDFILSEIPFIMFVCLSFLIKERLERPEFAGGKSWAGSWALGLCLYLAYGTRAVGLLLIPSLLIYDWIRHGRPKKTTLGALSFLLPLLAIQNLLFHSEAGHILYKLSHLETSLLEQNLLYIFPFHFFNLWTLMDAAGLKRLLGLLMLVLVATGFWSRLRKTLISPADIFVALYLVFFLMIPCTDTWPSYRYFLPVYPFIIFYAVLGLSRVRLSASRILSVFFRVCIAAILFFAYLLCYMGTGLDSIQVNIEGPQERALYSFLKENTALDDICVYYDPRVIAYYTGRTASQYTSAKDAQEVLRYIQKIQARCWIKLTPFPENEKSQVKLMLVYRSQRYWVYKILNPSMSPDDRSAIDGPEQTPLLKSVANRFQNRGLSS